MKARWTLRNLLSGDRRFAAAARSMAASPQSEGDAPRIAAARRAHAARLDIHRNEIGLPSAKTHGDRHLTRIRAGVPPGGLYP
jgi:hypothetical protein